MTDSSRRDFLKAAAVAAAGTLSFPAACTARAIPPIGRTRPSHLKLSLAAYSYRQFLAAKPTPTMDLFDFREDLRYDMGLDGTELTSYYFPPDVTTEYLHKIKQHAFLLGLDISGTSVANNFCLPHGPAHDQTIAHVRTWIDKAAGARRFRDPRLRRQRPQRRQ